MLATFSGTVGGQLTQVLLYLFHAQMWNIILTTWYLRNMVEKVVRRRIIFIVTLVTALNTSACVETSWCIMLPSQRIVTKIVMLDDMRNKIEIRINIASCPSCVSANAEVNQNS
jgi:hypothetical protein